MGLRTLTVYWLQEWPFKPSFLITRDINISRNTVKKCHLFKNEEYRKHSCHAVMFTVYDIWTVFLFKGFVGCVLVLGVICNPQMGYKRKLSTLSSFRVMIMWSNWKTKNKNQKKKNKAGMIWVFKLIPVLHRTQEILLGCNFYHFVLFVGHLILQKNWWEKNQVPSTKFLPDWINIWGNKLTASQLYKVTMS